MKLGVRNRIQAVVLAHETGMVKPGQTEAKPDDRMPAREAPPSIR
jgi:hypothetical protein